MSTVGSKWILSVHDYERGAPLHVLCIVKSAAPLTIGNDGDIACKLSRQPSKDVVVDGNLWDKFIHHGFLRPSVPA